MSNTITIPKPQIFTGPAHQTVDEATVDYLRSAARRVRDQRYWGSGVSTLVADLLDSAAAAMGKPCRITPDGWCAEHSTAEGPTFCAVPR